MGNVEESSLSKQLKEETNPFLLGKARHVADPMCRLKNDPDRRQMRDEVYQALADDDVVISSSYQASRRYGYGRTAAWTPLILRKGVKRWNSIMLDLTQSVDDLHSRLNRLLVQEESYMQQTVIDLTVNDPDRLKEVLETSWNKMIEHVNEAFDPEVIGGAQGQHIQLLSESLPVEPGRDLNALSLEFLTEIIEDDGQLAVPLYRVGANHKDPRDHSGINEEKLLNTDPPTSRGAVLFNEEVRKHYRRVHTAYLVPHINLTDLMSPVNLLSFLQYRGRLKPEDFARTDNDQLYIGKHTKFLSAPFLPAIIYSFIREADTDKSSERLKLAIHFGYGNEPIPVRNPVAMARYKSDRKKGNIHSASEMYLILRRQFVTLSFLCHVAENLYKLRYRSMENFGHRSQEEVKDNLEKARERARDFRTNLNWFQYDSLAQYVPAIPYELDTRRHVQVIDSKAEAAEQHIHSMFDDPEYLVELILEQKDHHWGNIVSENTMERLTHFEEYSDTEYRHQIFKDSIRMVLRRGIVNFYIWHTLSHVLSNFNSAMNRVPDPKQSDSLAEDCAEEDPYSLGKSQAAYAQYKELVVLIRYYAMYFVNEFRVKAIHAASEPMRGLFMTQGKTLKVSDIDLDKGHFDAPPLRTRPSNSRPTLNLDDQGQVIAELIDNFIANRLGSMHTGMRKITARLKIYMNDATDQATSSAVTDLVAEAIDSLNILADLAEYLELHHPILESLMSETEQARRDIFSKAGEGTSIDLLFFDRFKFDENAIPKKRYQRIFRLLDEMQGFVQPPNVHIGQAKTDLKRLGASLMRNYIRGLNSHAKFQANDEALERLEEIMGVSRDQYAHLPMEMLFAHHRDQTPEAAEVGIRWPSDRYSKDAIAVEKEMKNRKKRKAHREQALPVDSAPISSRDAYAQLIAKVEKQASERRKRQKLDFE